MHRFSILVFIITHLSLFVNKSIGKRFHVERYFSFRNKGIIKFGDFVGLRKFCNILVEKGALLEIGNNVFFNNYCSINCLKYIKIGSDSIFGEGVKFYDHNHNYKMGGLVRSNPIVCDDIIIGENVWCGSNCVLLAGIKIGNGAVIGANSVVYRDIPDNSLYLCNGELRPISR
jgi:acetyltransferase-like isoleucine patch superfamily enzyme